jgi:pimeloyl-ACP methyl ester carboxylesterase
MSKPQLVLVAGAWHAPFYMATMVSKLEALGYTIHARQLPGVGSSSPPKDLSEDIAALRSTVEEAIGAGNDVVVICHSWGGILTSSGLPGLSKKEREADGKKGGVVRVGYMTAFILDVGTSLLNAIGDADPPWFDVQVRSTHSICPYSTYSFLTSPQLPFVYAASPEIFYNDLPEPEQLQWHAKLQSQTYATFEAKTTAASWKVIPSSYLLCEDDLAIPAAGQQAMIEGVREKGGVIEVTRIKAGHSPFLSKVDETVEWVRKVAGESI